MENYKHILKDNPPTYLTWYIKTFYKDKTWNDILQKYGCDNNIIIGLILCSI